MLLDFDGCASFFELRLDGFCVFLADFFFQRLRSAVDQFLRFLQAETGDFANNLDDVDLWSHQRS